MKALRSAAALLAAAALFRSSPVIDVVLPPVEKAIPSGSISRNPFFYNIMQKLKDLTGVPPGIRIGANRTDFANSVPPLFLRRIKQLHIPKHLTSLFYQTASYLLPGTNGVNFGQSNLSAALLEAEASTSKFASLDPVELQILERKAVRRLDVVILPMISMFYLLSFLDRAYIGNARVAGLQKNLGMTDHQYQICITVLYVPYILAEIPTNLLLRKIGPRYLMPSLLTAWSTMDLILMLLDPDNVSEYVAEWTHFANAIFKTVEMAQTGFLAGSSTTLKGFSPPSRSSLGILKSITGKQVTSFSEHHYQGAFCSGSSGLLSDLMNKATIRGNLFQYKPDIEATVNQSLDYILGETNSYSCHGAPGSSTINLISRRLPIHSRATIKINQVFFHDGIGFKYNLVQPIALDRSITVPNRDFVRGVTVTKVQAPGRRPQTAIFFVTTFSDHINGSELPSPLLPHVQPQYYSAIVAAETIGNSGDTRISELTMETDAQAGTSRSYVNVKIQFPKGCNAENLKTLDIRYSDDTSGLSWGGQSYETSNGLADGVVAREIKASQEYLGVPVSQAALVTLQS
ncbi:hypothetical protein D9757_008533 [Collybiopsis confluens]|uniref:Uncharacterized protein n=1 Tax=Collybiopsis confluens TaxID=2823264 RepID=A0A8H5LZS8_9AGAR|nr:hypothetical protein D9757_008533 [Collybiopsis confluens]